MNTKSILGSIIIVVLIATGIVASMRKAKPAEIPLGVVLPLTGDAASYGEHARNAVELAREKARRDYDVVFDVKYEDSQIKPALAASAAQKLISADKVNYIVGFSSSETLAMCPITEAAKCVLLSSGSSPAITDCGGYTFRNYPSDIFQGKALAGKVQGRGLGRIALLYIANDYGTGLKNEFARNFRGIVLEEGHAPETRDFRTTLAKLKSANPDALVLVSQIAEGSILLRQMLEQGIAIPVFGSEALKDDALIENVPPQALANISVLFTASYGGSQAAEFKSDYSARFGQEPGAFADYVYDNVLVLAKTIAACKKDEVECVKNKLNSMTFTGATGTISFDENGDVKDKPYELYRVENGRFVLVE